MKRKRRRGPLRLVKVRGYTVHRDLRKLTGRDKAGRFKKRRKRTSKPTRQIGLFG